PCAFVPAVSCRRCLRVHAHSTALSECAIAGGALESRAMRRPAVALSLLAKLLLLTGCNGSSDPAPHPPVDAGTDPADGRADAVSDRKEDGGDALDSAEDRLDAGSDAVDAGSDVFDS